MEIDLSEASSVWSAVASALAAIFSAMAAFIALKYQRHSARMAMRPELVLLDWSRSSISVKGNSSTAIEKISARCVKNVGQGTALHLRLDGLIPEEGKLVGCMSTRRIPLLEPNGEGAFESFVVLDWDKVASLDQWGTKLLDLQVWIECWDHADQFHRTIYGITVFDVSRKTEGSGALAPGIFLRSRTTLSRGARRIALRKRLSRVPIIGRAFREFDPLPR